MREKTFKTEGDRGVLYHFSEEACITVFKPMRLEAYPHMEPAVWAIDEEHDFFRKRHSHCLKKRKLPGIISHIRRLFQVKWRGLMM